MDVQEVIDALLELLEDSTVPKNLKIKISIISNDLQSDKDLSLKVNKSLSELEEISNDVNLPTFVRTQMFGISSMLEELNSNA